MSELGLPTSFCSSSSYAKKKKSRAKHVPLLLSPLMPPGMPKVSGSFAPFGCVDETCSRVDWSVEYPGRWQWHAKRR
jgi:hypothetical protein